MHFTYIRLKLTMRLSRDVVAAISCIYIYDIIKKKTINIRNYKNKSLDYFKNKYSNNHMNKYICVSYKIFKLNNFLAFSDKLQKN